MKNMISKLGIVLFITGSLMLTSCGIETEATVVITHEDGTTITNVIGNSDMIISLNKNRIMQDSTISTATITVGADTVFHVQR